MRRTTLTEKELNKRAAEVFELQEGDYIYDVIVDDDGKVLVNMEEVGSKQEGFRIVNFNYEPNMSERSEALAYLLGERDDFND